MNPKSGKAPRLFVNPFAIWTHFAAKSGEVMLDSAQAAVKQAKALKVAVLPNADAPPPKALRTKAPRAKVRSKAKGKKRRAKR
jgi:hypothetical protein